MEGGVEGGGMAEKGGFFLGFGDVSRSALSDSLIFLSAWIDLVRLSACLPAWSSSRLPPPVGAPLPPRRRPSCQPPTTRPARAPASCPRHPPAVRSIRPFPPHL